MPGRGVFFTAGREVLRTCDAAGPTRSDGECGARDECCRAGEVLACLRAVKISKG